LDPVEVNVAHISLPHTEEGNKERRKKSKVKTWKRERKERQFGRKKERRQHKSLPVFSV